MASDRLIRALAADGAIRAFATITTAVVASAQDRHTTAPTATAALGRTLTGALLLGSTIKRDERLSIEISGDGPLKQILADATSDGDVRGFVRVPSTHLPPKNGKLDVGGAVGSGRLCVMRVPIVGGTPYRSIVALQSGEIGIDLAHYLLESEQVPSAVGVGVYVEPDGTVGAAGGFLLQAMPDAPPALIDQLATRVEAGRSPTAMIRAGLDPRGMLHELLGDLPVHVLEEQPVQYRCRCTRERVTTAILAMGRPTIEHVLATDRQAEVTCDFCATRYVIDAAELEALLTRAG